MLEHTPDYRGPADTSSRYPSKVVITTSGSVLQLYRTSYAARSAFLATDTLLVRPSEFFLDMQLVLTMQIPVTHAAETGAINRLHFSGTVFS